MKLAEPADPYTIPGGTTQACSVKILSRRGQYLFSSYKVLLAPGRQQQQLVLLPYFPPYLTFNVSFIISHPISFLPVYNSSSLSLPRQRTRNMFLRYGKNSEWETRRFVKVANSKKKKKKYIFTYIFMHVTWGKIYDENSTWNSIPLSRSQGGDSRRK